MKRRTLLAAPLVASVAALAMVGCTGEGKMLQVSAPPPAQPTAKVERVVVWLPPETGLVSDRLGDAFVSAFAKYNVPVRYGRASALELNRGEDQARLMNELRATHRVEVEVSSFRQAGGTPAEWTLAVAVYTGTGRTRLMTVQYRPGGAYDYSVANAVVQQLHERGYL
ncbi:MAG: hypothetical protein EPO67_15745 [Reyranella sp.]|nr:MAG: hypothetical protein EPO67_15745 [Reyranella sp.]